MPHLSLDLVPCSPKITTPSLPSPKPQNPLPMHEFLLLSPSPLQRSKTRLVEKLHMAEEPVEPNALHRRCKNRNGSMGLFGCASPRNGRRSRRRFEPEIREVMDLGIVEEMERPDEYEIDGFIIDDIDEEEPDEETVNGSGANRVMEHRVLQSQYHCEDSNQWMSCCQWCSPAISLCHFHLRAQLRKN